MQTGCVVEQGVVVHQHVGGAGRVEQPRWGARHHAAHDRPHLGDLLMALAVAELGAARDPVVAVVEGALARTGIEAGGDVAVDVVPRPAAEP